MPARSVTAAIADRFPWLGTPRRLALAALDTVLPPRASYAQHGEDLWAARHLEQLDLREGRYVDVGGNHPTRISNTYLFYRRGLRGVVVEPNLELAALHRLFRPRDVVVAAACGRSAGLATLHVASTPVLSALRPRGAAPQDAGAPRTVRHDVVPVVRLDDVVEEAGVAWIPLLSIDTEGFEEEVLAGASRALERTLLALVETSGDASTRRLRALLEPDFGLDATLGCNLAFRRRTAPFAPPLP